MNPLKILHYHNDNALSVLSRLLIQFITTAYMFRLFSHHSFASPFIFFSFSPYHTSENDNEWMNNKFATAVMMAEQQSNFTLTNYDCDRTLFSQHDNNCLQHHVYQDRSTYHNEVPTSSIGYIDNRVIANVRHFPFFFARNHQMSILLSLYLCRPSWRMQIWRLCKSSRHSTRAQHSEGRVMAN